MISVQLEDFDCGQEYDNLRRHSLANGAIVTFVGLVREFNQNADVTGLFLEHYPGMTEKSLQSIVEQAKQRWPVDQLRVIHRIGQLDLGDQIVFVGASSPHREAAFAAANFVMDYLKTQAPFWKKESTQSGQRWVDANQKDTDALKKWSDE